MTPSPMPSEERLPLRDELTDAEHEVAAFLHPLFWGSEVPHVEEPGDGDDCHECYGQAERLFAVIEAAALPPDTREAVSECNECGGDHWTRDHWAHTTEVRVIETIDLIGRSRFDIREAVSEPVDGLRSVLLNLCMAAQIVKWAHDEGKHNERQFFDDLELQVKKAEAFLLAAAPAEERGGVDELASMVRRTAIMGLCSQTHHEHLAHDAAKLLAARQSGDPR